MERKFNPQAWRRLVDPQRVEVNDPEQILAALQLQAGQTLVDVGCGPGWFTLPAADMVGSHGKVFAVDVAGEMLAVLRERLAVAPLPPAGPVEPVLVTEGEPWDMAAALCHRGLLANVFHEVSQVEHFLSELKRVLLPGALTLVVEWKDEPMSMGPPPDHRLAPAAVEKDFSAAGFTLVDQPHVGPYHYGLLFSL